MPAVPIPVGRFRSRIAQALGAVHAEIGGDGLPVMLAEALRADPRGAEIALRDQVFVLARDLMGKAFEHIDDHGPSVVDAGGVRHWRAPPTPGRAMTLFGPVRFRRSRYRPSGGGRAVRPTEAVLGIGGCGMTPAAEEMSLLLTSSLTHRECEEMWRRIAGRGPSLSTMMRKAADAGRLWAGIEEAELEAMREREVVPGRARTVQVSLDGVMMRMQAETDGDGWREAGWREASTGVVQLVGEDGEVLSSRCFGRLPEPGKRSLKRLLTAEVMHLLKRRPDLKLVAVADGAPDNWTWLESLEPDRSLVDFWHSCQHLKACADDAFGEGSGESAELVQETPQNPAGRCQGHRPDHRSHPPSHPFGPGWRDARAGTRILPQEPGADGLQGSNGRRMQHRFRLRGGRQQIPGAAEDEAIRAMLGTRGWPGGADVPFPAEIGTVRCRLPQPPAPQTGKCAGQTPEIQCRRSPQRPDSKCRAADGQINTIRESYPFGRTVLTGVCNLPYC